MCAERNVGLIRLMQSSYIGEAFKNVFPLVIDSLNLAQPTHKEQFYGVEEEASEIKEKKEKGRVGVSRKLID
jgi:hypothetical protein